MRPVSVFANGPGSEIAQLQAGLHGRRREAARAVVALLSVHELAASQIEVLQSCHPATVSRWISRFHDEGIASWWTGRASQRGPSPMPTHVA